MENEDIAADSINSEVLADWLSRFSDLLALQAQPSSSDASRSHEGLDLNGEIQRIREVARKLGARSLDIKLPTRLDDGCLGM